MQLGSKTGGVHVENINLFIPIFSLEIILNDISETISQFVYINWLKA